MSTLVRSLLIYAPGCRQMTSILPYYFRGAPLEFAVDNRFQRWLSRMLILLLINGAGLYVFSVQASFLEARRLELFEKRISEETKAVAEISAIAIELSSPQFLRAAAEKQAMIETSKVNFIRQDSSVALQTKWQP